MLHRYVFNTPVLGLNEIRIGFIIKVIKNVFFLIDNKRTRCNESNQLD